MRYGRQKVIAGKSGRIRDKEMLQQYLRNIYLQKFCESLEKISDDLGEAFKKM